MSSTLPSAVARISIWPCDDCTIRPGGCQCQMTAVITKHARAVSPQTQRRSHQLTGNAAVASAPAIRRCERVEVAIEQPLGVE
jgi:hypothetical protein